MSSNILPCEDARPFSDEGWSIDDRRVDLPDGLRIARYNEAGWVYKTPTHTLWVTDTALPVAQAIEDTPAPVGPDLPVASEAGGQEPPYICPCLAPLALTCEQCGIAKQECAFQATLNASLLEPVICDDCLSELPRCASCNDRPGGCYDCEPSWAKRFLPPLESPATRAAPSSLTDAAGPDAPVGAMPPPFTRTPEHDLRPPALAADAWTCATCHQVFWTGVAVKPLVCPLCEHQAAHPAVEATPTCPACGGAHALSHCREFAEEWRRQELEDRAAGERITAHIQRDFPDFLRGYATLTPDQRAGVVRAYCALQRHITRPDSTPTKIAERWALLAMPA